METPNYIIQAEIKDYETRYHQRQEHSFGGEIERDNAKFYFISPYSKLSSLVGVNGETNSLAVRDNKKSNYKELVDFAMTESRDSLDLTWLDHNDTIVLCSSTPYKRLRTVEVNIDNLLGSFLPSSRIHGLLKNNFKQEFQKKHLVVHGENAQLNFVQQIKAFRAMLAFNHDDIDTISLTGFNSAMDKILSTFAKIQGIAIDKKNGKTFAEPEITR